MSLEAEFGYRIAPCDEGWAWTAYDEAGEVRAEGAAPTKAMAAACVIREIARKIPSEDARAA
ncbi:MAG TPA: hypothetical protein VIO94_04890 [Phenylobacterium sp.]